MPGSNPGLPSKMKNMNMIKGGLSPAALKGIGLNELYLLLRGMSEEEIQALAEQLASALYPDAKFDSVWVGDRYLRRVIYPDGKWEWLDDHFLLTRVKD